MQSGNILRVLSRWRLKWFGRVKRKEEDNSLETASNSELEGRRPARRPRKTWKGCADEGMRLMSITQGEVEDRSRSRRFIARLPPNGKVRT